MLFILKNPLRAAVCHADGAEHAQRSSFSCALICWFKEQSKRKKKTGSMFSVISRNVTSFNDLFLSCTFTVVVIAALWLRGINYVRLYADYLLL